MRCFYSIILLVFISQYSYSQKKATSSLIKGHWIIENESNQFYNSDTLIFYKQTNTDKSVPSHHGKRPFIESESLIKKGDSRVHFELNLLKRAICSEITFSKNLDTMSSNEWMWGKWTVDNNTLEIKSEHHYHWKFKIREIEKISFIHKGKEYSTIKMVAIKRKFENED